MRTNSYICCLISNLYDQENYEFRTVKRWNCTCKITSKQDIKIHTTSCWTPHHIRKDHSEVSRLFDLLYASPFYMTYLTIQVIYSNERMKYVLLRGSSMRSDRKGLYCLSIQKASGWKLPLEWIQWKSVQSCKHNLHVIKYIASS